VRRIALSIIRIYKNHISPLKGFRCAYGVFHGGKSCSTRIYEIIEENGLIGGIPLIRAQLNNCSSAYSRIAADKERKKKKRNKKKQQPKQKEENSSWCDLPCHGIDCLPVGRCGGGGKGGDAADGDIPFDLSP